MEQIHDVVHLLRWLDPSQLQVCQQNFCGVWPAWTLLPPGKRTVITPPNVFSHKTLSLSVIKGRILVFFTRNGSHPSDSSSRPDPFRLSAATRCARGFRLRESG